MRRKTGFVIWPQYFDKNRSRKMGRRISKNKASINYTLQDVFEASKRAGFVTFLDPHPKFPAAWWEEAGRIIVEPNNLKKYDVIKRIAPKIPEAYKYRITEKAKEKSNKSKVIIKVGKGGKYAKYDSVKDKQKKEE